MNQNITIATEGAQSTAYYCPKCQSPSLTKTGSVISLDGKLPVHCSACQWDGDQEELLAAPFKHGFANDEEVARSMANDLRLTLSKEAGLAYARFLRKWGFLEEPVTAKQVAQYLEAIAGATFGAIVELRQKMVEKGARERAGL